MGEGPSTLLSWSRSGRSCPFQYRGALSFLRPCAGPARLVVVGTHPEKGATQATQSGSNPALHGSKSSAHCPSQILVLLPQLQILSGRRGWAGGRERVKESEASSAVQGLEVRIAGLGGRWAGALQPALSEGHEAWGIAGIAFTCCWRTWSPTVHSALNSMGFISLLSGLLSTAFKPRWVWTQPCVLHTASVLDCVGKPHSNIASSDRLGHSPSGSHEGN